MKQSDLCNEHGLIVCGYPGVGKSSVTNEHKGFIDLESSWFHDYEGLAVKQYCDIGLHLALQGYVVFMSSHPHVLNCLSTSDQEKLLIYPSVALKDAWISRLCDRYSKDPSSKNLRAYSRVNTFYASDIAELRHQTGFQHIVIDTIDYNLYDVIKTNRYM